MRTRDSVLFALAAAVVGLGAGFLGASLLQGGRPAQAASKPAAMPRAPQAHAVEQQSVADVHADPAGVDREVAAAQATAVVPRVPEAELERALGTIDEPTVTPVLGAGTIRGEVQDEEGMPLQGAVIVAVRSEASRASDPHTVGGASPEETSLAEHLRESAQQWAKTRGATRRATSGADGRFEISGLVESASYRVSAFLDGQVLEAEGTAFAVSPGQRIDFRAEPVARIPVRLVFQGGGQPSEGVVGVKRGEDERLFTWTSEEPVLRLTAGRVGVRGYAGVLRAEGGRNEVDSTHASVELSLEVADQAGAPIDLVLVPRTGIRGRVVDATGASDGRLMVRLLALGSDGEVDLDALAESRRYARLNGDRFHLLDLPPGQYALGLSDWNNALIAHQVVTVAADVVEVELVVPEPDPEQHLIVRVTGPTGRALRDLEFRWEARNGNGSRSGNIQGRRAPDGSYWLRPKADYFGAWNPGTAYTLTIVHAQLGERAITLEEGQREVDVSFVEPVTLVVVVAGYAGSGYVGRLQLALTPIAETRSSDPDPMRRVRRSRSGNDDPFSPEGVARLDGLAPGRWKLDLLVETGEWETRPVQTVEVVATHGEQTVEMALPALYDLAVRAPGLAAGSWLFLMPASGANGEGSYDGNSNAELGADGRAVFRGLAAGTYLLRANGVPDALEVTVPCSEVLLEARQPDCLRVAIGDLEGKLYKAGLRAGDLIVAVNGVDIGASPDFFELLMGEGEMELSVLRDGRTFAVPMQRIPMGSDWWNSLGGMLSPETRP